MAGAEITAKENGATKSAFARRVVIESVRPEVDCGRFPIKRTVGELVEVTADIFADGHDLLYAVLRHRSASRPDWQEVPMEPGENDRWQAVFRVEAEGRHLYTLQAWTDRFLSWSRDIVKKFDAAQDLSVDILVGAQLIEAGAQRASRKDRGVLATRAEEIKRLATRDMPGAVRMALSPDLRALMIQTADRRRRCCNTAATRSEVPAMRPGTRPAYPEGPPRRSTPPCNGVALRAMITRRGTPHD